MDDYVPQSVAPGPDPDAPAEDAQAEEPQGVVTDDAEEAPEPYTPQVEQAADVSDVKLAEGEEITAQRLDEAEGVLYIVTSHGRKIALDGRTATTVVGVPPAE